ncbi:MULTISPECIES: sugar transferase [Oceanobacillus]|uniref:sugar transferase n=1 Tax=Oceanobacillus TaxID=182709 RepID=UPI0025A33741|nr:sugar transferase [Oceanobacillus oncorhynchi]MDM8101193.1 sugar transferase [Oceanobacillus oncorhynchi]
MYLSFKRIIDFIISLILLVILSPLFIITAVLIKVDSRGPIIFKQPRIGRKGKTFKVWKFRTMIDNAESMGGGLTTAEKDPRITNIGNLLRKISIDEIPQLVNILKGDMSFIGPRPAPVVHLKKYNDYDKIRLKVLPGITGWAQVNGRNKLTWPERIEKDVWYVRNISFLLDIKILLKTIKVVLLSEGIYSGRNDSKVNRKK